MPSYCKECKEQVAWAEKICPFCGTANPTGMNTELLWMAGIAVAAVLAIPAVLIALGRDILRAILH